MPRRWYPVAPDCTPEGALCALVGRGVAEADAALVPPDFRRLGGAGGVVERVYSAEVLASLGIESPDLAGSGAHCILRECLVYEEVHRRTLEPGLVRGVRWGGGIRLTIALRTPNPGMRLTAQGVARMVESSHTEATYRVSHIGLDELPPLDEALVEGRFDASVFARIQRLEGHVGHHLQDHLDRIRRHPIAVLLADTIPAWLGATLDPSTAR